MATPTFQIFTTMRYDGDIHQRAEMPDNGHYYMVSYHRDRLMMAAAHFGWTRAADILRGAAGLARFLRTLDNAVLSAPSHAPIRLKILMRSDGTLKVEKSAALVVPQSNLYPQRIPPPIMDHDSGGNGVAECHNGKRNCGLPGDPISTRPWMVVVDPSFTVPSLYMRYKTTYRHMYESARVRAGIESMAEEREVLLVSAHNHEIMEGSLTTVFFWRNGRWITPAESSGGQLGTSRRWALEKGLCVEGIITLDSLTDGEECWISNGARGFQLGRVSIPGE